MDKNSTEGALWIFVIGAGLLFWAGCFIDDKEWGKGGAIGIIALAVLYLPIAYFMR